MTKQSITQNTIVELPEDVGAHLFGFLTTAELELFGKTNKKTYKNTKASAFLRRVHSTLRERSAFDTFWRNLYEEKEHEKHCAALEGIVAKLGTLDDGIVSYNFITSLDTSSLKNFNHSIDWLADHNDDVDWLHLLNPHPNSHVPQLDWTPDELELVDLWHEQHSNRYLHYLEMD